jgi:RimJ/RimL family protein N-acetyltransferase
MSLRVHLYVEIYREVGNFMVQLAFYEESHKQQLLQFNLPADQHQFTGLPSEVLEITIQDDNRYPIVILNGEEVVGFFVLHHGEEITSYSTNPNAILLRALSIDFPHQGKGYAKTAMKQLPLFMKTNFPQMSEIVLVVNERNLGAKKLYDGVGFIDRGERRMGEIGPQYLLHLELESTSVL